MVKQILKYPIALVSVGGIWLPDQAKSKIAISLYTSYQIIVGIWNTVTVFCECKFVVDIILAHGTIQEYNDTLFISLTGINTLVKLFVSAKFIKKPLRELKDLLSQKIFLPTDEAEAEIEDWYEKIIKLSMIIIFIPLFQSFKFYIL